MQQRGASAGGPIDCSDPDSGRYRAIGLGNIGQTEEWGRLDPDIRRAIEVLGGIMPFRTNRYVMDSLIDWTKVPDDPIFQLVFPQREMLSAENFQALAAALGPGKTSLGPEHDALVARIRADLNPHPAGQLTDNVPLHRGAPLWGVQHKYRETVLFFPTRGQTCHAYCSYCFRWPQFTGERTLRFDNPDISALTDYLRDHTEVTDVVLTGGDPMVMNSERLRENIAPLLGPGLEHIRSIRLGTKAVATWPARFVTDPDADDCLRLFEEVVATGRHLAIMGHYTHPRELAPDLARRAIQRIRDTGAQIRMQAPLARHINDSPDVWADLWRTGVRLGLIPYYMFIARDTGPRDYFKVPLAEALTIYQGARTRVSGLARSVQGPSMSTHAGKIRILAAIRPEDLAHHGLAGLSPSPDSAARETGLFVCDFLQARDSRLTNSLFFAAYDPEATWFDDLKPAFGQDRFPFQSGDPPTAPAIVEAAPPTETLETEAS